MLYRLPLTNHQVWNRTAQTVAQSQGNTLEENARMFALLNIGLHDGLQTSFASKFHYELWRPITAIRRAAEDGNDDTAADPTWMTLHPSTPPYPTYAGNASTIGAVCATVLAEFYGTDDVPFTVDWSPYGFPGVTRSYDGFWEAADEHARSREYGGIHFRFDSAEASASTSWTTSCSPPTSAAAIRKPAPPSTTARPSPPPARTSPAATTSWASSTPPAPGTARTIESFNFCLEHPAGARGAGGVFIWGNGAPAATSQKVEWR
jgi:hypothetical protein